MVTLPFQAVKLLFTRKRLLAFAFFPGVFTFFLSSVAIYLLWEFALQATSLWISLPAMIFAFVAAWLLFGNLSLLPVEDFIVDECQRAVWGEVRLPGPKMSVRRVLRELRYSVFLLAALVIFSLVSFLPFLGVVGFFLAAWLTAYGFLSSLYARKTESGGARLELFFRHCFSNFLLGALINVMLFVPVLNVFLLGYAQILATLVFLRREGRFL